ncbi:MAG: purine-binding chemotaxis protein CheW [Proteobacteria bacterium]|nr:purine-binding chemotaxis protein CheW [Pseudomonadota bacterium]
MTQIATFQIGNEVFGIDILLTKEIGKITEITKVPGSSEFILGLMNLRGQIVTIMDPGVFLDQNTTVSLEEKRLIILKKEDELEHLRMKKLIRNNYMSKDTLAIVVDHISDVIEVEAEEILPPPPNLSSHKKEIVSGIIQQGDQLVILLEISQLAGICIKGEIVGT